MTTMRNLFIVLLLTALSAPAWSNMSVGVVDLREAVFSSEAAAEFGTGIQAELEEEEQQIRALQQEAEEMQQRLETDGAMMSDSERERLSEEFERKVQEFQQRRGQFEQAVNQHQQQFLQQSRPLIDEVMEELLEEHDLDIILPAEAVIYVKPDYDLTEEMIRRLNEKAD